MGERGYDSPYSSSNNTNYSALDSRKYLRRFFGSQWTKIFGPAFVTYLLLTVPAAAITGDWSLPLLLAFFIAIFLFRGIFFAGIVFFPFWIALIIVWAGYELLYKNRLKKENNEASSNDGQSAGP